MAWPTTNNPRTEFVTLRLTADEAADLDWLKGVLNERDRSKTLRAALLKVLAAERRKIKTGQTKTGKTGQKGATS